MKAGLTMDAAEHLKGMAYHEAGHAVVAWALGLPVGDVYVRKMDEGNGAHRSAAKAKACWIGGGT
jgi:hypothetical protein